MKKLLILFTVCGLMVSCGKKGPEKTKTVKVNVHNLQIDMPESWKVSEETYESIEITGGANQTRLFYIKPLDSDTCILDVNFMKELSAIRDGYKFEEEVKLKNGVGIRFEDKPGKDIAKNYWFMIQVNGTCYSVENGPYNDQGKYYQEEIKVIESIR